MVMRELGEQKGYGHLGLKGQNLRYQASRLKNHKNVLWIIAFDVGRTQHIILGIPVVLKGDLFCGTHLVVRVHFLRHLQ